MLFDMLSEAQLITSLPTKLLQGGLFDHSAPNQYSKECQNNTTIM